jgi:IPT/TIG domain/Regulator of chromosome condensation (RCC1) repeat
MPVVTSPCWRSGSYLLPAVLAAVCCVWVSPGTVRAQGPAGAPTAPAVASISPVQGPTSGDTVVTIGGSGFGKSAKVEIGGRASAVSVRSETEITARTPAEPSGRYEVIVSDVHGASSNGPSYTYLSPPVPTVTSITPAEGPTSGDTAVTLTGSGFAAGATVEIGGTASAVSVHSETEITALTPSASAGRDEVIVSDAHGASSEGPAYIYRAPRTSLPSLPSALAPSLPTFAPVTGSTEAKDSAGTNTSVVGWGKDAHGALGAGYTGGTRGPVSTLVSGARAVVAGSSSYALLNDGTVAAWGDNTFGQLGNGSHQSSGVPAPVNGIVNAVAIAAGGSHAMALLSNGTVMTWGGNTYGTLGNGTSGKGHEVGDANPMLVPELNGVTAIAAGGADDVALMGNGTLEAWGENKSGQLGDGTYVEKDVPTPVRGLYGVRSVAVGGDPSIGGHMLILMQNGAVMAIGGNLAGQLGNGTTTDSPTAVAVRGLSGVVAVSADISHSMALLANGTVMTWGSNDYGQLGVGAGPQQCGVSTCSRLPLALALSHVTAISAGFRFSLAVSGGSPFSWGWNQHRELGDNSTVSRTTPAPVPIAGEVSAIAAGEFHSLAIVDGAIPPPALEVSAAVGALTVHWLTGEEPRQRWIVQWRPAGEHAPWSPLIYLPLNARAYTVAGLGARAYEVLVRNTCFGSRVITGTPLR